MPLRSVPVLCVSAFGLVACADESMNAADSPDLPDFPASTPPPQEAPPSITVPPPLAGGPTLVGYPEVVGTWVEQWQRFLPATPRLCDEVYTGCAAGDSCTWEEAKRYCDQLMLDGGGSGRDIQEPFRLPTLPELRSILRLVEESRDRSAKPPLFSDTPHAWFWTADTVGDPDAGSPVRALSFDDAPFDPVERADGSTYGDTQLRDPAESLRVRCYRSATLP